MHLNKAAAPAAQHVTSWDVFEGLSDWSIVQLMPREDNDDDKTEVVHRIVLDAKVESLRALEGKLEHSEQKIQTRMGVTLLNGAAPHASFKTPVN
jgi:hypothetical protein